MRVFAPVTVETFAPTALLVPSLRRLVPVAMGQNLASAAALAATARSLVLVAVAAYLASTVAATAAMLAYRLAPLARLELTGQLVDSPLFGLLLRPYR